MSDLPRPAPDECEECNEELFLNTYCNDCDQWMCNDCDKDIHRKGKRARHTRRYRKEGEEGFGGATATSPLPREERDSPGGHFSTLGSPEVPTGAKPARGGIGFMFGKKDDSTGTSPEEEDDDDDENWVPPSAALQSALREKEATETETPDDHEEPSTSSSSSGSSGSSSTSSSIPIPTKAPSQEKLKVSPQLKHSGILKKRKKKGLRMWQERYCKLYSNELQYYRSQKDPTPAGTIPLGAVKEILLIKESKGLKFDVAMSEKSTERTFSFAANTQEECRVWMKAILDAVQENHTSTTSSGTPSSPEPALGSHTPGDSSPTNSLIASADAEDDGGGDEETERDCELTLKIFSDWEAYKVPCGDFHNAYDRENKEHRVVIFSTKKKDETFKETEKAILEFAKLDNPFFLNIAHHGYSSDRLFAIFETPGDSIALHLDRHRRFPENVVRVYAAQLIQGIALLHERKHVFQNLSPYRIFLDPEDGHAAIGDVLAFFPQEKVFPDQGPPEYAPPDAKYTPVSDWWRFGILLYEMVTGVPPIRSSDSSKQDLPEKIRNFNSKELKFPPEVSSELQDFIRKLLVDASSRLGANGAAEVKAHDWLAEARFNWQNLLVRTNNLRWISDNIIDPRVANTVAQYRTSSGASTAKYSLQVELGEGRNFPYACEKGIYFQLTVEDQVHTTAVYAPKEGEAHSWNFKGTNYSFNAIDPEIHGELVIEMMLEAKGRSGAEVVGLVSFPLHEIKSVAAQSSLQFDIWAALLESTGLPTFAELNITLKILPEKETISAKPVVTLKIPFRQTFFDYFGKPGVEDIKPRPVSPPVPKPEKKTPAVDPYKADAHKTTEHKREELAKIDLSSKPSPPPIPRSPSNLHHSGSTLNLGITNTGYGSRPTATSFSPASPRSNGTDHGADGSPVRKPLPVPGGAVKLPPLGAAGLSGLKKTTGAPSKG